MVLVCGACSTGGDGEKAADDTTTTEPAAGPTTTGPLGSGPSPIPEGIGVEVLSSQADRISGDDVRLRVTPPPGGRTDELRLDLDGRDVSDDLEPRAGALEGVVDGLIEGTNTLTVRHGELEVVQRLRAWPITGPIISGPHLPLLVCSTEENELGPALDDDCSAAPVVRWRYISTDGTVKDLTDQPSIPADLATARIDGAEVPLYVRHERGVINRSVYDLASVAPAPSDDEGGDLAGPGWNGRLLYRFGGGCATSYGQGRSGTNALEPAYLRQGYVVATATFNTFGVQCNDVLSAETAMMVKEHMIESFGVPEFTIGEGASGGAIQLHLLAQNYPGIVNGLVAALPFPDAMSIAPGVTDCGLLLAHYESDAGRRLTPDQRRAIAGHASERTCSAWKASFLDAIDPTVGCDPGIDPARIYHPDTNRGGLRCTLQDANRNQFGTDPETGFARRPLDNVGVQYGLGALNEGDIDWDEFLTLNEAIGGYDIDGRIVDARSEADPDAVLHLYETGRISMGGGDQRAVPIIDLNLYLDPSGDIHDRFRAFSLRDRLTGGADADAAPGFQIWTVAPDAASADGSGANPLTAGTLAADAVAAMDDWLSALADDPGGAPMAEVLRRTRPPEAVDTCVTAEGIERGTDVYERPGPCRDRFPIAGDPRTVAGAPRANHILKCMLKPVDRDDYARPVSDDLLRRLRAVFPKGVCDWDQPGEGQIVPANPDRSYEDVSSPEQDA
jgi:hypothetical protein